MNLKQLFALAWLRFKLSINQQKKAGELNVILTRIVYAVLACSSALSFIVPIAFGHWFLQDFSDNRLLAIWNGMIMFFLFSAAMSLMGQLQLNEVISIEKLLHLPVSLNGAFLINYLSSLMSGMVLVFAPAMLGFTCGVILAKGTSMFILLPALLAILFLTTSLFHQLKATFARIMQNKRNKAIVVVVIPFVMVMCFVMFSFFADSVGKIWNSSNLLGDLIKTWLLWKPNVYSVAGIVAIGFASQYFSYRALIKFYTGADTYVNKSKQQQLANAWASNLLFRKLPFSGDGASAVATAGLRSIIRAPEALMALMPPVLLLLVGIPYLVGYGDFVVPNYVEPWLQILVVAVTMLGFPAFLFTAFSYDRDGFRAFVLSPLKRKDILYGKNLAAGIPTIVSGVVLLAIIQIFLPDSWLAFASSLLQLPACFLAMCIVGNFLSVWFPVGLKRGNMQPANAPMIHTILLYTGILIAPFLVVQAAMLFIFFEMLANGNFGPIDGWLYLPLSAVQLAATWLIYRWTLTPLGQWLWKQEPKILDVVANIPE